MPQTAVRRAVAFLNYLCSSPLESLARHTMLRAALLVTASSWLSPPASACEPLVVRHEDHAPGLFDSFFYPANSAARPVHLPVNSKGVLYRAEKAPLPSDFIVTDTRTGARVPVQVTPIKVLGQKEKFALTRFYFPSVFSLFRIEPQAGFHADTGYAIETVQRPSAGDLKASPQLAADRISLSNLGRKPANGKSGLHIYIDAAVVDPKRLGLSIRLVQPPNRESVRAPASCWVKYDPGVHLSAALRLPAQVQPYAERLIALPVNLDGASWSDSRAGSPYPHSDDQDPSQESFGIAPLELQVRLPRLAKQGAHGGVAAVAGLLEVDDALYPVPGVEVPAKVAAFTQRDSLDFLRIALRSGEIGQLRRVLGQIPVRETDVELRIYSDEIDSVGDAQWAPDTPGWTAVQRRLNLVTWLIRLLRHQDKEVRRNSAAALKRTVVHIKYPVRTLTTVVGALAASMRDPDLLVRQASHYALADIVDANDDRFCHPGELKHWFGNCLDKSTVPRPVWTVRPSSDRDLPQPSI